MDRDLLQSALGPDRPVSDRLIDQLQSFLALSTKWNAKINLVARSTIDNAWRRHIVDSAQIFVCAEEEHSCWLDIGSGGGFPGIVIAILAEHFLPHLQVHLVESDRRKSVFLTHAGRVLGLGIQVSTCRIEDLPPQKADVVSARALAPLSQLCSYAAPHLGDKGVCAFLKGENAVDEIAQARKDWLFDLDCRASITEPRASVIFLRRLAHA